MAFGGPSIPQAPGTPPPPPTVVEPAAQTAADQLRMNAAAAAGRASTILTGPRGVLSQPPTARRVLLGGS